MPALQIRQLANTAGTNPIAPITVPEAVILPSGNTLADVIPASLSTVTLLASGWSSSVYSFESTYPVATYDIEIELNGATCTAEQYSAWSSAMIVGNPTANTIKALGTVPTIDIPIVIRATKK